MKGKKGKILIVDDDRFIILSMKMLFDNHFEMVDTSIDPNKITQLLNVNSYDVILLDMNFNKGDTSGDDGIYWLQKIKSIDPLVSIITITAYGEIQKAVRAVKAGALDFVVKPWQNEKLLPTVMAAAELSLSKRKIDKLRTQQLLINENINKDFSEIIGESTQIIELIEQLKKIAPTDANVLISGENGTGKEVFARAIHNYSNRFEESIITVDMGSLTESLFESELFGHVAGAFTDAKQDRIGRFEAASGGSLFLDEISNTPLNLQSKLLKALQDRVITPVGSNKLIEIDIRLICASNVSLTSLVNNGNFRQDLLYRINTVEINIPPLRERQDDIPLLAEHFLSIYKKKYQKKNLQLPKYVSKKLMKFRWPGNVRELQHAIERAVIMSDGNLIKSSDFQFLLVESVDKNTNKKELFKLDLIEKQTIINCINQHAGNLTKAAKDLGLTRGSLYRRMEKYGL